MRASIVIRTFNEARYLPRLLEAIAGQDLPDSLEAEVLVVDSGSTDATVEIARNAGARIVPIRPEDFSFGRSLNLGCAAAAGDALVFVSGHCVPCRPNWLAQLVAPLVSETASYTYGRQIGGPETRESEHRVFAKLYPTRSRIPQDDFFCNNANAALRADAWRGERFDEDLLGLEDLHLAQRLVAEGHRVAYVAEAPVFHYHHETWQQIYRRYEREAIALQRIRPEWHLNVLDLLRFFVASVAHDSVAALRERRLPPLPEIVAYRWMQYWGSYRGNHEHRRLAASEKRRYFYPVGM